MLNVHDVTEHVHDDYNDDDDDVVSAVVQLECDNCDQVKVVGLLVS